MSLQSLTERVQTLVGTDSGLDATFKFITDEGIISVDTKQVPNIVTNNDLETEGIGSVIFSHILFNPLFE